MDYFVLPLQTLDYTTKTIPQYRRNSYQEVLRKALLYCMDIIIVHLKLTREFVRELAGELVRELSGELAGELGSLPGSSPGSWEARRGAV